MRSTSFLDALTMSLLNFCVALVLTALHLINGLYDWPNPFVTIAAPLAAAVFFILTALWFLQLTRSVGPHRSASVRRRNVTERIRQRARVSRFVHALTSRRGTRSAFG